METTDFKVVLTSWGMEELIPLFEALDINITKLWTCTDDYFLTMIPDTYKVKHNFLKQRRLHFANTLSAMQAFSAACTPLQPQAIFSLNSSSIDKQIPVSSGTSTSTLINPSSQFLDTQHFNRVQLDKNGVVGLNSHSFDNNSFQNNEISESTRSPSPSHSHINNIIELTNITTSSTDRINSVNLDNPSSCQQINSDTSSSNLPSPATNITNAHPVVRELYSYKNYFSTVQQNLRLYKLLDKDSYGIFLLYEYSTRGDINTERLCQIIVDDLLYRTTNGSLPFVTPLTVKGQLTKLAQEIVELFPGEREALYYQAGYKSKEGERANARGLLQDYWIKKRWPELFSSKLPITRPSVSQKLPAKSVEQINISLLCEKYNKNELEVVSQWTESRAYRHEFLFPKNTADELYEKLKVLHDDEIGAKLIRLDFIALFSNYNVKPDYYLEGAWSEKLILHWPAVANKIILNLQTNEKDAAKKRKLKAKKRKHNSDPVDEDDNNSQIESKYDTLNASHAQVLAFMLIHKVLNYTPQPPKLNCSTDDTTTENQNNPLPPEPEPDEDDDMNGSVERRPTLYTQARIVSNFILHLETEPAGGLQKYIDNQNILEQPSHPYTLVVGALTDVELPSYVIYKKVIYKCDSPTHAVDLCFKWFFVLHEKYPRICQHLYSFLQVYVYGIGDKIRKPVAVNKIHILAKALK